MAGAVHTAPTKKLNRIACIDRIASSVLLRSDWVGPSANSRPARGFTATVKDIIALRCKGSLFELYCDALVVRVSSMSSLEMW
jgi:hypothetical protein